MKTEGLWLRRQFILLARLGGGSPLEWLNVPLWQLNGWIRAVNELDKK